MSQRLIFLIPPYYRKSKITNGILGAIESESDRRVDFALDVIKQGNPILATWGLTEWERQLKLSPVPEGTAVETRRARVLSRLNIPPLITPREMERIVAGFTSSRIAKVIEYGREKRFVIQVDIDELLDLRQMVEEVRVMRPKHLSFETRLGVWHEILPIDHVIASRIHMTITTRPWALSGGRSGRPLYFDGSIRFDGNYFFTGYDSNDGPGHEVKVRLYQNVVHSFGVFTEFSSPTFDGRHSFNGQLTFNSVPQPLAIPVKHGGPTRVKINAVNGIPLLHQVSNRVKIKAQTGATIFNGSQTFNGETSFEQTFYKQPATLRVKKNGVVTEVVNI